MAVNIQKKVLVRNKLCSECNTIKPVTDFNLTNTGLRHKPYCKECDAKLLNPKQTPKTYGRGKNSPLSGSGTDKKNKAVDNFWLNFNKLKGIEMRYGGRKANRYKDLEGVKDNTKRATKTPHKGMGYCIVCDSEVAKKDLKNNTCFICRSKKNERKQNTIMTVILKEVKLMVEENNLEWFSAKQYQKYCMSSYDTAFQRLKRMEEYEMLESKKDERYRFFKLK